MVSLTGGNPVNSDVRHLLMTNVTDPTRRMLSLIRWLPVGFAFCVVILLLSLWLGPISIAYLTACALFGIVSWIPIAMGYWKNHLNVGVTLATIFLSLGVVLHYFFFSPFDQNGSSWSVFVQYGATVYTVICGLTLGFRSRVMETLAKRDAEQIVGPEPPPASFSSK